MGLYMKFVLSSGVFLDYHYSKIFCEENHTLSNNLRKASRLFYTESAFMCHRLWMVVKWQNAYDRSLQCSIKRSTHLQARRNQYFNILFDRSARIAVWGAMWRNYCEEWREKVRETQKRTIGRKAQTTMVFRSCKKMKKSLGMERFISDNCEGCQQSSWH